MVLRDTLLYLAQNERLHQFVISNRATRSVSRRFVAGEVLDDAIQATRVLNQRGMHVSLDHLGENVSEAREARSAARDYISILDTIKQTGVDANISIKLTALGLDISQELCEENVCNILENAQKYQIFVRIDMEASPYTEQTVDITLRMHQQFEHVGTVIQSCLYRSKKDVEQLVAQGVRIRDHGISKEAFEFQMLYGIRRDLQEKLVSQGYNMRIYVPYGSQWYPYLMRRLAERPANLMFVMSNMWR